MSDDSESEYDTEDDEDYVPGEASSEEDAEFETDEKKGKKKSKPVGRKRKGGIKLDEDDDEVSSHEESEEEEDAIDPKAKEKDDMASKQRVQELWAAFKQDTAVVKSAGSSKVKENVAKKVDNKASTSSAVQQDEKKVAKKVEVTEIFDFAGEEVKVVKLVDPSSVTPPAGNEENKTAMKPKTTLPVKRPGGGLGSVLGKIGKKPKMSTLEKSKLDWNSFKKDEGIEDELKRSNRDGFLEKQAFLNRVDYKQFEIERDIRQGARKR